MTHRLRGLSTACSMLLLSLLAPAVSGAATVTINATPSATFSPATVTIQVGDTVTWHNTGGFHNVRIDGILRCADGCDENGGNGSPSSVLWTFSHTFNASGTFTFYCQQHGGPTFGMKGTITVEGATPPPPENGTLKFSQANYSVSEAVGNATITVSRVSGSDGAVAVSYAATAGSAATPADFGAASGTLSWAAGDAANKSFTVAIVNDTLQEPNETVLLALSSPTGGAVLDATRKTATLTIADNDAPSGGGTPAAPTGLEVTSTSTSEIGLSWHDSASNETGFRIEQKLLGGAYAQIGTVGANVTTFTAEALDEAKLYSFRVRAAGSGDTTSAFSNEVSAATDTTPAPCVASASALCLNGGRFKAQVSWRTGEANGSGSAVPIPSAPDSGLFFFFNSSNIEMLIKALNACSVNSKYWVFYAATTNVEFTLTVTDTQTGKVKIYFNPLNSAAAPIQDTSAFATCP